MKPACERCATHLGWHDAARICSFECTFCPACATAMESVCPNCAGPLVTRPVRERAPLPVAAGLIRRRLGIGGRGTPR
ncbi:DUF1272 domain-containing protein [Algiphilus sp.]|uniref:DUF1272 domain-containing protein n=1 Tax=Algiphilus sp. TaxID=1872431 RepID=UPI0025B9F17B|nr:DUF1272 domain-containing protein [Algiphilus sp.]